MPDVLGTPKPRRSRLPLNPADGAGSSCGRLPQEIHRIVSAPPFQLIALPVNLKQDPHPNLLPVGEGTDNELLREGWLVPLPLPLGEERGEGSLLNPARTRDAVIDRFAGKKVSASRSGARGLLP